VLRPESVAAEEAQARARLAGLEPAYSEAA
jgi:hypothetical protein